MMVTDKKPNPHAKKYDATNHYKNLAHEYHECAFLLETN